MTVHPPSLCCSITVSFERLWGLYPCNQGGAAILHLGGYASAGIWQQTVTYFLPGRTWREGLQTYTLRGNGFLLVINTLQRKVTGQGRSGSMAMNWLQSIWTHYWPYVTLLSPNTLNILPKAGPRMANGICIGFVSWLLLYSPLRHIKKQKEH